MFCPEGWLPTALLLMLNVGHNRRKARHLARQRIFAANVCTVQRQRSGSWPLHYITFKSVISRIFKFNGHNFNGHNPDAHAENPALLIGREHAAQEWSRLQLKDWLNSSSFSSCSSQCFPVAQVLKRKTTVCFPVAAAGGGGAGRHPALAAPCPLSCHARQDAHAGAAVSRSSMNLRNKHA